MYIMFEATIALFDFPFDFSMNVRRSLITEIKKAVSDWVTTKISYKKFPI